MQDFVDELCRTAIQLSPIHSVRHQSTCFRKISASENCWEFSPCCESGNLSASAEHQRIIQRKQPGCAHFYGRLYTSADLVGVSGLEDLKTLTRRIGGCPKFLQREHRKGRVRVHQSSDDPIPRDELLQNLQSPTDYIPCLAGHARNIAARPVEARDQPCPNGIA